MEIQGIIMTVVAGFNRVNRQYFFTNASGARVEIPAFGLGGGDLVGDELREFNMYATAKQIEARTPAAPVNTVIPVITGTARVGVTLTASTGTWTGVPAPVFTYQWQANSVNIVGATAATYVPIVGQVGQTIRCVVTGTNASGAVAANSAQTAAVIAA